MALKAKPSFIFSLLCQQLIYVLIYPNYAERRITQVTNR